MALSNAASLDNGGRIQALPGSNADNPQTHSSGVSWGAIFAGAAAAVNLILIHI